MKVRVFGSAVVAAALMVCWAGAASAQSLQAVIASAQAQLGGEVDEAERMGSVAEVEILSNGRLVKALFDFKTSQLIESEAYNNARRTANVQTALDRAALTLPQAIDAALAATGPGDVLEGQLVFTGRQSGRQFVVDIRTASGTVDVVVDALNGRIIRIDCD